MACKSCAERRARMKAWLKERFRVEEIHRKAKQQAGRSRPQHQQQEVEGEQAAQRAVEAAERAKARQGELSRQLQEAKRLPSCAEQLRVELCPAIPLH